MPQSETLKSAIRKVRSLDAGSLTEAEANELAVSAIAMVLDRSPEQIAIEAKARAKFSPEQLQSYERSFKVHQGLLEMGIDEDAVQASLDTIFSKGLGANWEQEEAVFDAVEEAIRGDY